MSAIAKLVKSIAGETPPLRGQSAPSINQRNLKGQSSSALPPSMSAASARRRGGPAGPGRSLFTVSSAIQPVPCRAGKESLHRKQRHRNVGEEHRGRDAPAPRAERTAIKPAQPPSSPAIPTPRSTSVASARERGRCDTGGLALAPESVHQYRTNKEITGGFSYFVN